MVLSRSILLLVLIAELIFPLGALAQIYPDKPVRVIVAFPPGGSNDIVSRIVFQKMTEFTGQQFVIDNRGGASGIIGAAAVAKSAPDGYTVMIHSATHISNAYLRKLPYDTLTDFVGVTPLARQVFMLVVHSSMPVKTTMDFIAFAEKKPNQIFYPSGGNGTPLHLAMALFTSMTGTKLVHVQFKGGAPAVISIVSGETQVMAANIGVISPYIKTDRVRPLGVTSANRIAQFPAVPTIGEAVPGYEFTAWVGLFVPAGTPASIVDKLNAELKKTLADPDVSAKLTNQTFDPFYMTPEKFSRFLRSEYEKYGMLIRTARVKNE